MNWKRFCMVLFTVATTFVVSAQANLLNAKKVEEIGKKTKEEIDIENDKPLPYGYINDRDILWSKIVWEYVDLNQKINLPYYYPVDSISASMGRRSLFDTLMEGIKSNKITEIYEDSYFGVKMSKQQVIRRTYLEKKLEEEERDVNNPADSVVTYTTESQDIKGYMLKGIWYFDKRQGELKYRLLGIAPASDDIDIRVGKITERLKGSGNIKQEEIVSTNNSSSSDEEALPLFWVFFPDARETLHKSKVFNPKNSAHPISYDNLLNARRFNSTIEREENLYGDRKIKDYVRGNSLFQLLEADRIKEGIRDREMDMWNY